MGLWDSPWKMETETNWDEDPKCSGFNTDQTDHTINLTKPHIRLQASSEPITDLNTRSRTHPQFIHTTRPHYFPLHPNKQLLYQLAVYNHDSHNRLSLLWRGFFFAPISWIWESFLFILVGFLFISHSFPTLILAHSCMFYGAHT